MMNAARLPLTGILTALVFFCGCANFAQRYNQAQRDVAAREHRGTGFKPTYDSEGYYTGYTQKVGGSIYRHTPSGTIIGVSHEREMPKWVEHHDEQGRLLKKTLEGPHLNATQTYHYSPEGELLGVSSWLRRPDGTEAVIHSGADGYALKDQVNLPWGRLPAPEAP